MTIEIKGLNYMSFYLAEYQAAVEFYTKVLGEPEVVQTGITGWRMGNTWLTFFPSKGGPHPDSNPRNGEFAIEVGQPGEVDQLHGRFVAAGGRDIWPPEDTEMYEPMRFGAVDDPFGIRVDIYCPRTAEPG